MKKFKFSIMCVMMICLTVVTYQKNKELFDQTVINAFSEPVDDEDILRSIIIPNSGLSYHTMTSGGGSGTVTFMYNGKEFTRSYSYSQYQNIWCCLPPNLSPENTDGCAAWSDDTNKAACVALGFGYTWWDAKQVNGSY